MKINDIEQLISEVKHRSVDDDRFVIAVSGFAGSGKSSVCRLLEKALPDCSVIKADDFIRTDESGAVYGHPHDYDALERSCLRRIKTDTNVIVKTYEWKTNKAVVESRNVAHYTIIDGPVGLFQDKLLRYFDLRVWIDCPLDIATARGKQRDKDEYNLDLEDLWDTVWLPEQERYYSEFRPDLKADIFYKNY